jgi:aryl-alcohol dehydrogenase-like predicted oxidoreductase
MVIVSKVGEEFAAACRGMAPRTRFSVERSLQRLEAILSTWCWCIPMAMTCSDPQRLRSLATLADSKAEGKIRGFGFSDKTVDGGLKP